MNVMTAGTTPFRQTPVRTAATPATPSDTLTPGDTRPTEDSPKDWGGAFRPSKNVKKGAYALAYFGLPFAAGLLGAGQLPAFGTMALSAGAGVYAAREQPGMQKALAGLSGFVVANASHTLGAFAINPSIGGAIGAAFGGLMLALSGPRLLAMSE